MTRDVDEVNVVIGATLRQFRTQRSLSLETVGQAIGVTYQQIQKYEMGHNRVSARNLYFLSRLFEVDITAFFDGLDVTAPAPEHRLIAAQLARIKRGSPSVGKALMGLANALASPDR